MSYQRHLAQTKDNDTIAIDFVDGGRYKPMLIILHGLEGSSRSQTVRLLADGFSRQRWNIFVPHFRSCGGHPNRLPRSYHAADVRDVNWMVEYCRHYRPHRGLFVAGVSLGGNALMHYLAQPQALPVDAGLTVSAPFDLSACVKAIDGGINRRLYCRHLLKTLRQKIYDKAKKYPSICDRKKLRATKTLAGFDRLYTAPVHGFASAEAYWEQGNATKILAQINTPLLCINADNDPLIPTATLPAADAPYDHVQFNRPRHGGHGAFAGRPHGWLCATAEQFFAKHLPAAADSSEP